LRDRGSSRARRSAVIVENLGEEMRRWWSLGHVTVGASGNGPYQPGLSGSLRLIQLTQAAVRWDVVAE
jgi:hypothetical protein